MESGVEVTLRQYQQLSALAEKQNQSVNDFVKAQAAKAVQALLKTP